MRKEWLISFVGIITLNVLGCSHIQFGREFDGDGKEIEQSSQQPAVGNSSPISPKADIDKHDEDYFGEDEADTLNKYAGQLAITEVSVSPHVPRPYANTRKQRMTGVWGSNAPTEESLAAEAGVLELFKSAAGNLEALLPQYIVAALDSQLALSEPAAVGQTLVISIEDWGLSDRIGLYSSNLRAELAILVTLLSASGDTLWSGRIVVDANESDRPMADKSEYKEDARLLLQHFEIAAQFAVHKAITTMSGETYAQPDGYNPSRWVDIDGQL